MIDFHVVERETTDVIITGVIVGKVLVPKVI